MAAAFFELSEASELPASPQALRKTTAAVAAAAAANLLAFTVHLSSEGLRSIVSHPAAV
jgi:hypothetical protein